MKLLSLFKNRKYKLAFLTTIMVLVVPNFVFAYGILDFGVMILSLFARLTGWAGILLNLAIMELVFNMGNILNSRIGASVENSWAVIRDIMNLLFIFSLIYIGFQVILDYGSPRRLLPPLIIAALLINFSLFFTKFVVDISNVAAVEIYTKVGFIPDNLRTNANLNPQDAEDALINIGVSGAYMQAMGLKDLISPQNDQSTNANLSYADHLKAACAEDDNASDCDVTILVYFLASIVFFLIAAYAFAIGAYMLLWRFITLVILMILSPLMFIGMIFPKAQKYQSRWWNTFFNAAFFAPAYMLTLYIGYTIASKINVFSPTMSDGSGKGMFDAVAGKYAAVDLILNFVIVCGFLLMAVAVGKEMSSQGGKGVLSFMDNVRRRGQQALYRTSGYAAGAAMGAGAAGIRNTVGAQAYQTANAENEKGKRLALQAQGTGIGAWAARQRLAWAKRQSEASYDPRQLMSKGAQKNLGAGKKGGYSQSISDRKKAEEGRSKLYGQNDSQVYADYGVEEQHKKYEELGSNIARLRKEIAASSSASERRIKTRELGQIIAEQKAMEKGTLVKSKYTGDYEQFKAAQRSEGKAIDISEDQFNKNKQRLVEQAKKYADARKQESGYGARQYAENLKNRYTGNKAARLFGWFYDDPIARKAAAKDITKKNSSKSSGQKIEEIVKELQKEEGSDSTPPATPPSTA